MNGQDLLFKTLKEINKGKLHHGDVIVFNSNLFEACADIIAFCHANKCECGFEKLSNALYEIRHPTVWGIYRQAKKTNCGYGSCSISLYTTSSICLTISTNKDYLEEMCDILNSQDSRWEYAIEDVKEHD